MSTWGAIRERDQRGEYVNNTGRMGPMPMAIRLLEDTWFDQTAIDAWFARNWHISVYMAVFYLVAIYVGKKYMATREPFSLRGPLIVWNFLLAVFSICGAYRFIPGFYLLAKDHGFKGTLCANYYYHSTPEGFWVLLFVTSKIPELVDTFFIVARKRKLIFLHWYHHTTVMMYSFYLYRDRLAGGAYYGAMNFTVHAIMYTYYFFAACKIRLPRFVSMTVTTLQISQMFVGVFVTCYLWTQLDNPDCPIHFNNVLVASLMYSTYLFLFAEFFVNTYILKKPATATKKKSQ